MEENLLFAQASISPHIYTVSEITREIKALLSEAFPFLWIKGEVSNITTSKAGHTYFTLKDKDSQINCVLFGRARLKIPVLPQSGEEISVGGLLTVYEKSGGYQIVVEEVLSLSKKGRLWLEFEKLKERLKKEGLFDPAYKKPIPALISKVAVVTSPTGAAIQDILKHLPDIEILIFGVSVQGEASAREIASALARINRLKEKPDVIIVGRGGGAIEDLWSFNEEITARAIFSSVIPVISAVGHETDITISDMVADYRAPTPTAAGQMIRKVREDAIINLKDLSNRLTRQLEHLTKREGIKLKSLADSLVFTRPYLITTKWQQRLDDLYLSCERAGKVMVSREGERLKNLSEIYKRVERRVLDSQKERLVVFEFELSARINKIISRAKVRLASASAISSLDPKAPLKRGYSITYKKDGSIVRASDDIREKEGLEIKLGKGRIETEVTRICATL
ncbi:MAG: exodeoxyribonuclease VII large subunit [bacterium]